MKNKKDFAGDKKYYRILKILNLLNEKGTVKISELALEFAVTPRSIQRDLERINMTFGLDQSSRGEYSFAPGVALHDMRLSGEQMSALIFMNELFKGLGGNFSKSFEGLFQRMTKTAPWNSPYAIIMPRPSKNLDVTKFIPDLEIAVTEHRQLCINYENKGKQTEHLLAPIKILVDNGFYYILAMSAKKDEFVKYRLDKIKELSLTGKKFSAPANLEKAIHDATSVWGAAPVKDRKITMKLKIAMNSADFFRKKEFFPLQRVLKTCPDGSIILESKLTQFMEAIPVILGWIPDIEVLAPPELKKEIVERVGTYLKNTGNVSAAMATSCPH